MIFAERELGLSFNINPVLFTIMNQRGKIILSNQNHAMFVLLVKLL